MVEQQADESDLDIYISDFRHPRSSSEEKTEHFLTYGEGTE